MKIGKIFLGLAFIAVAVLLILNALGILSPISSMFGEITFWQILGGVTLFCLAVASLIAGDIGNSIILLGFIFMIFERNIAFVFYKGGNDDIINNWLLFGCTLLLAAGFSMLKPKKWKKVKKIKTNNENVTIDLKCNEMGSSEIFVDCAEFGTEYTEQKVYNRLGSLEVRFVNVDRYKGDATLNISNKLGVTEIYVPQGWKVKHNISISLGSVEDGSAESYDENAPILNIIGTNSLGSIEINRD